MDIQEKTRKLASTNSKTDRKEPKIYQYSRESKKIDVDEKRNRSESKVETQLEMDIQKNHAG